MHKTKKGDSKNHLFLLYFIEMSIISNSAKGKILKNDVLALSQEAKKAKKLDNSVVNATIGSLFDDKGNFYVFDNVNKLIKNLPNEDFYSYSPNNGNPAFHKAVTKWVFGPHYDNILSNMSCESIPTPGGTGAVSNSLFNALDAGETLILPDIYWGPYKNMAQSNSFEIIEYKFIVDGKFNIEGFKKACLEVIQKQGKVVTILNDPCNNPTGYSLSNAEFKEVIEFMNSQKDALFNMVYDIAYFDYYTGSYNESRQKFELMLQANENILFNIAFSCSKTFSVYGLRLGAQIILSKNSDFVKEIYDSTCFLARTRWSNVSKAGLSMMIEIDNNEEIRNKIIEEIQEAVKTVNNRADVFVKEAKECNLDIYPYSGGFFITVHSEDGIKLADELKKDGIYVLGFKKAVRIAICSVPIFELKGLAQRIKNRIK